MQHRTETKYENKHKFVNDCIQLSCFAINLCTSYTIHVLWKMLTIG